MDRRHTARHVFFKPLQQRLEAGLAVGEHLVLDLSLMQQSEIELGFADVDADTEPGSLHEMAPKTVARYSNVPT